MEIINNGNYREIIYAKNNLFGNLGTLVNETKREVLDYFKADPLSYDGNGVYIYQTKYNRKMALRVYKDFLEYNYNGNKDDILIKKLNLFKEYISLTDFPTGIVTFDGKIIGQEIVYYEDYIPLYDVKDKIYTYELIELYFKCLNILSELENAGINYIDVHARNFLVNNELDVKLIDFEYDLVKFNNINASKLSMAYLYNMINLINNRTNNKLEFEKPTSIYDAFKKLELMKKYN